MSTYDHPGTDEAIEAYLDQLLVDLPGRPRQVRHALAEIEAHLGDAAAAGRAGGLDPAAAALDAVRRLGPKTGVADRPGVGWWLRPALRRRAALATLLIGGVAGLAVGVGGIIGWAVKAMWGSNAVAVAFPAGSYGAADCHRWLAGYPSARTCLTAMTADHADDFLRNAAAGGVLGLLALAAYLVLARRWATRAILFALPRGAEWVLGAGLGLLATVVLVGQGIDAVTVTHGNGAGQPFSLAAGALFATALFTRRPRHSRPRGPHHQGEER